MAKSKSTEDYDDYLSCRLHSTVAEKFREKAKRAEKRKPSDMLRVLVEGWVEEKANRRELATAGK